MFIGPDIVGRERLTADEGELRTNADRGESFFLRRGKRTDELYLSRIDFFAFKSWVSERSAHNKDFVHLTCVNKTRAPKYE